MTNYIPPSRREIDYKSKIKFKTTLSKTKNCTTCVRCECNIVKCLDGKNHKEYGCIAITDEEAIKQKSIYRDGLKFKVLKNNVCCKHKDKKKKLKKKK
jgi:hypothetical protein